jgi:hypothetical protein
MKTRFLIIAAAFAIVACGKTGDYSRGVFHGQVIEKTAAEVEKSAGKPASIEQRGKDQVWGYAYKTFDPENMNRVDLRTLVVFDASGKVSSLEYVPLPN